MRYRALDANGDYQFGAGVPFLVNSPATVAQAIRTRLSLIKGSWFLDNRVGLDTDAILGYGTQSTRDQEIQQTILKTSGVLQLLSYTSTVDNRDFVVNATVETIYGTATFTGAL